MAQAPIPSTDLAMHPRPDGRLRQALILLALGILLVAAHYLLLTRSGTYANRDFMIIWGTGRAVIERVDPYDTTEWFALYQQQGAEWFPNGTSVYPLWTGLLVLPLAALPLSLAAALWLTLIEALLAVSLYLIVTRLEGGAITRQSLPVLMIGAFLARWTVINIHNGQITLVLLAAICAFLVLLDRDRPFAAGLALSLAALKPNVLMMALPVIGVWLIARRRWRVIAGGAVGGAVMLVASWLVQPGWIGEWLGASDLAMYAPFQTPTVWGLSHLIWPDAAAALGLVVTVLATAGVGWFVLRRRDLTASEVTALAVAYGLFTTPYAWAYEHALLFLPIAMITARARSRWMQAALWLGLCLVLPWALFGIASQSGNDSISGLMPLIVAVGVGISWSNRRTSAQRGLPIRVFPKS